MTRLTNTQPHVNTPNNKKAPSRDTFVNDVATQDIACPKRDETVTLFTALKSLISRGSSKGQGLRDSSASVSRSDVRGPVVTPIGTAVTPLPPEDISGLVAAYESGDSLASLAGEHRLGKETIRRLLTEAGVRIRRQGLREEQVGQAVRAYKAGQTIREVGSELGVGHSMVWRALKNAGIELRPNARRVGRKLA